MEEPGLLRRLSSVKESACPRKQSTVLRRLVDALQVSTVNKGSNPSQETTHLFVKQNQVVGRETELKMLDVAYQRVLTSHSEVVLIHGQSGAGKSTLVEAFVRQLPPSTFYVSGKFDQMQSHAPYAALVSASNQLCRQVLQRGDSSDIRDRIRDVLGSEMNLLGSLIPTIAKMTAEKQDGDANMNTAHNSATGFTRFKLLFRAFLRYIASSETPILLFLDDIQWADGPSLEVLRALVSDNLSKHIMIVGAYRDGAITSDILRKYHLSNDSGDNNDESSAGGSSSSHRARITDITVSTLDVNSLNNVVASVLGMGEKDTFALSNLVLMKTDGNAFYALNFLDMLVSRSLLSKSEDGSRWIWNIEHILDSTNVSDNLAAIFEAKLGSLPEQVRAILQIASFIGYSFTTEVLVAIVHEEQDMIETEYSFDKHSQQVILERIIVALEVAILEGLLETTTQSDEYKFSHDRVQQCLYFELMPDSVERSLLHQRIGTRIWSLVKGADGTTHDFDDWLFLAAENLNRAVNLMDYSGTRYELIEVNLRAAKLSVKRSAFHLASSYLRIAVDLLDGDASWNKDYIMCLDLYYAAAEAEKNVACYDRSKILAEEIHKRAKSPQDQLKAYSIEMESLAAQGNLKGAVKLGLSVLRIVGVKFPAKISTATVVKELALVKIAIGTKSMKDLFNLPEMTNRNKSFALEIMNVVAAYALTLGDSFKNVYAAVSIRMIRVTVSYGLSPLCSVLAFMTWGTLQSAMGQFDTAIKFAQLSFDLVEKFDAEPVRGAAMLVNYGMSYLWRRELDGEVRHQFLQAYHLCMSFGDVTLGFYGFMSWLISGIHFNAPLGEINRKTRSVVSEGREYNSSLLLALILPSWQVLLNLSGDDENPHPSCLAGEAFDNDFAFEMKAIDSKMTFLFMYHCELMMAYTYENLSLVEETLPLIRKLEKESGSYFVTAFIYAWNAVCHYELYLANGNKKNRKEGRRYHSQVQKWAATGTVMLSGVNKWLNAMESLCIKTLPMEELEIIFEEALMSLATNGNIFYEALANERLAKLFLIKDAQARKGRKYLEKSIELYTRWGATAKAELLETRYSDATV